MRATLLSVVVLAGAFASSVGASPHYRRQLSSASEVVSPAPSVVETFPPSVPAPSGDPTEPSQPSVTADPVPVGDDDATTVVEPPEPSLPTTSIVQPTSDGQPPISSVTEPPTAKPTIVDPPADTLNPSPPRPRPTGEPGRPRPRPRPTQPTEAPGNNNGGGNPGEGLDDRPVSVPAAPAVSTTVSAPTVIIQQPQPSTIPKTPNNNIPSIPGTKPNTDTAEVEEAAKPGKIMSKGAVAGIVATVGVVAIAGLAAGGFLFMRRRSKEDESRSPVSGDWGDGPGVFSSGASKRRPDSDAYSARSYGQAVNPYMNDAPHREPVAYPPPAGGYAQPPPMAYSGDRKQATSPEYTRVDLPELTGMGQSLSEAVFSTIPTPDESRMPHNRDSAATEPMYDSSRDTIYDNATDITLTGQNRDTTYQPSAWTHALNHHTSIFTDSGVPDLAENERSQTCSLTPSDSMSQIGTRSMGDGTLQKMISEAEKDVSLQRKERNEIEKVVVPRSVMDVLIGGEEDGKIQSLSATVLDAAQSDQGTNQRRRSAFSQGTMLSARTGASKYETADEYRTTENEAEFADDDDDDGKFASMSRSEASTVYRDSFMSSTTRDSLLSSDSYRDSFISSSTYSPPHNPTRDSLPDSFESDNTFGGERPQTSILAALNGMGLEMGMSPADTKQEEGVFWSSEDEGTVVRPAKSERRKMQ
ncbi:hypothetical protein HDU85_001562 [Gaertneriomyces sp. JEL0708]|nr:hypothetical protein HDU85_001562 [Gaertneriomyces sp. JEL0708]